MFLGIALLCSCYSNNQGPGHPDVLCIPEKHFLKETNSGVIDKSDFHMVELSAVNLYYPASLENLKNQLLAEHMEFCSKFSPEIFSRKLGFVGDGISADTLADGVRILTHLPINTLQRDNTYDLNVPSIRLDDLLFCISMLTGENITLVEPPPVAQDRTIDNTITLDDDYHNELLEVGNIYAAQVEYKTFDGFGSWVLKNPPIPAHYGVGFKWINLSDFSGLRDGVWTFKVTEIERWHDPDKGNSMGRYFATYICKIIKID